MSLGTRRPPSAPSTSPGCGRPAAIASRSAFACGTPADVDATYAELVGSGVTGHLAPWDAFWGQRYAVVLDPDGNHVELCAPIDVTS